MPKPASKTWCNACSEGGQASKPGQSPATAAICVSQSQPRTSRVLSNPGYWNGLLAIIFFFVSSLAFSNAVVNPGGPLGSPPQPDAHAYQSVVKQCLQPGIRNRILWQSALRSSKALRKNPKDHTVYSFVPQKTQSLSGLPVLQGHVWPMLHSSEAY